VFVADASALAARVPPNLTPAAALDWFIVELRRDYPTVTVREQSDLARESKDQVTWYATLHDERSRLDFEIHVPLPPATAFEIYVARVADWQRSVQLRPRKLTPELAGSEYDAVYTLLGRNYQGVFRILAANPPLSVTVEAAGSGITVSYTTTFSPEPTGSYVRVRGNYSLPEQLLARVADRLGLERAISRDVQRANEAYRRLCEEVGR
jgi:hypothetical protein